jgi:cobalamin biosynthesis Mg chelatase CobN
MLSKLSKSKSKNSLLFGIGIVAFLLISNFEAVIFRPPARSSAERDVQRDVLTSELGVSANDIESVPSVESTSQSSSITSSISTSSGSKKDSNIANSKRVSTTEGLEATTATLEAYRAPPAVPFTGATSAACCLLTVVCCLLTAVCWVLGADCWVLTAVCCLLSADC